MGSHNSRRTFGRSSRASLVKVRKSARVERGGWDRCYDGLGDRGKYGDQ